MTPRLRTAAGDLSSTLRGRGIGGAHVVVVAVAVCGLWVSAL